MNRELEDLLSIKQAAKILNVSTQTLRRWDNQGVLKAVRIGNRKGVGDRRYHKEDIKKFIKSKK